MAMNRQRRTSNINNIVTYDTLGNVTIPASFTVKGLVTAGFAMVDANGLFSVDTTAYQPLLPSQAGNSGKYLTTDGSVISWGTVASMGIGNAITSATAGSVLFAGTSGVLAQDNANFFWDDTNNRLGIGTATPTATLQVNNSVVGDIIKINGTTNSSLTFYNDSLGRTYLNVSGNTSATSQGGAYFTAEGYEEAWFNVVSRQASAGNEYWRFGNYGVGNYFAIQKLNDAATSIVSTPLSISSTGSVTLSSSLDVVSTGRFQDNLTIEKNQTIPTSVIVNNLTSSANAECTFVLRSDTGSSTAQLGKKSTLGTAYKIISAKDCYLYNATIGGDLTFLNDFATGKIKWGAGGSSTAQMTLTAAGRLLLGTTSESTYILDVNGTARVSGDVSVGTSRLLLRPSLNGTSIMGYLFSPIGTTGSTLSGSFVEDTGFGTILSYGVNVPQLGGTNSSYSGGIFRMDTRLAESRFSVLGYPTTGGYAERISISLQNGTTYLVPVAGNVGIGHGVGVSLPYLLDVNGTSMFRNTLNVQNTTASNGGQLSAEILTTGSGTNWTGTSFATGYAHTAGSVVALISPAGAFNTNSYQLTYTISGRTAGSVVITLGGYTSAAISISGTTSIRATATSSLSITPTSDFDGTIVMSLKEITAGTASVVLRNSSGTITNELRGSISASSVYLGVNSGAFTTTGLQNVGIGNSALRVNSIGTNNVAIGFEAMLGNVSGLQNVGIGSQSLYRVTTGQNNVGIGFQTLFNTTTGGGNVAIGYQSMLSNTTGGNLIAIGINSLSANTIGINNVAIGNTALTTNNSGSFNSAIGYQTMYSTTSGSNNAAYGYNALFSNTTGGSNAAIGIESLFSNTTGSNNASLGRIAGRYIADGSTANAITNNSIYIGYDSRALADNQTNQIVIGYQATGLGSNTTIIGNSSTITTALRGRLLLGTLSDSGLYQLDVVGDGRFTGNLTAISTTASVTAGMLGWSAVNGYVQTTIPASTSFTAIGYAFSSLIGNNYMTYQGSATFAADTFIGSVVGINNIAFTATSSTITITQSSSIRTYSAGLFQNTTSGSVNGTITHMSGLAVRPIFRASGTSTITVDNNYGLLIADQNEFSHATITNRWGVYQEGANDNNYFKGKVVIGSTDTVGASPLNVKNLPTSSAGLATGDIWSNAGVLTVV